MSISGGSLGGKNTGSQPSGERSSRSRPTIFKKLQALDRQIASLTPGMSWAWYLVLHGGKTTDKLVCRVRKLDEKRRKLRELRKKSGRKKSK